MQLPKPVLRVTVAPWPVSSVHGASPSIVWRPGFIQTDMTDALSEEQKQALLRRVPAGRLGAAREVAALVTFLAGDDAGYVTGETLHINGGLYMN